MNELDTDLNSSNTRFISCVFLWALRESTEKEAYKKKKREKSQEPAGGFLDMSVTGTTDKH